MSISVLDVLRHILDEAVYHYDIVWDVVKHKVPELRQAIEEIIDSERRRGG